MPPKKTFKWWASVKVKSFSSVQSVAPSSQIERTTVPSANGASWKWIITGKTFLSYFFYHWLDFRCLSWFFSPWINNCVGERNQKFFVLFCCYIALISVHALFMSVNQFAMCIKHEWKECSTFSPPATVILLLFLTFEGLLFAIFTIIMLGTQLNAIWTDETGIEQLKKEERKWVKMSRWRAIETVFGKFSILWLSPFSQPKLKKKIEGCLYPVWVLNYKIIFKI